MNKQTNKQTNKQQTTNNSQNESIILKEGDCCIIPKDTTYSTIRENCSNKQTKIHTYMRTYIYAYKYKYNNTKQQQQQIKNNSNKGCIIY